MAKKVLVEICNNDVKAAKMDENGRCWKKSLFVFCFSTSRKGASIGFGEERH